MFDYVSIAAAVDVFFVMAYDTFGIPKTAHGGGRLEELKAGLTEYVAAQPLNLTSARWILHMVMYRCAYNIIHVPCAQGWVRLPTCWVGTCVLQNIWFQASNSNSALELD